MSGAHLPHAASKKIKDSFQKARLQEDDELFRMELEALKQGSAIVSTNSDAAGLQTIDDGAAQLVSTIAEHARLNQLTPSMVALLADYLATLTTATERFVVLGMSKATRPTTRSGQVISAGLAYSEALSSGTDKAGAEIAAYDAYFAAGPSPKYGIPRRTHAADLNEKTHKGARHKNKADGTMASTIRPAVFEAFKGKT